MRSGNVFVIDRACCYGLAPHNNTDQIQLSTLIRKLFCSSAVVVAIGSMASFDAKALEKIPARTRGHSTGVAITFSAPVTERTGTNRAALPHDGLTVAPTTSPQILRATNS